MDAPEGLVAASGAGQEVREVGGVVRARAGFQEIQVPILDLVGFCGRRGACFAAQDHSVSFYAPGVDEAPGIRRTRTDDREQILAYHLAPSSVPQAVYTGVEAS